MARKKLTPFGIEVKKRLLDLGVSQSSFCREHGIPENRFSETLSNSNPNGKYRRKISRILNVGLDT